MRICGYADISILILETGGEMGADRTDPTRPGSKRNKEKRHREKKG